MSQTNKVHKLTIKNKAPGQISAGYNTEVFLDDRPLMAKFLKLEFHAKRVVKIQMEIYADVEIDGICYEGKYILGKLSQN
ncbi:MAG TPA: hypothetical protein VI911_11755 [Patescibacteria group bacterium]|nr:hypothetical protein [Patescibacteria group bacterium]